jgi:hypothetical protein
MDGYGQGGDAMAADALIEQRLTAVEQTVDELQRRLANLPALPDWLEQVSGSFKNEPAFEDVLELGRAIRSADRPSNDVQNHA